MATSAPPPPRLLPSGDSAITVEFSNTIDDEANRRVLTLDRVLAQEPIAAVTETVPTYRSLLVHYDPVQIGFDDLGQKLIALAQKPIPAAMASLVLANDAGLPSSIMLPAVGR